MKINKHLHTKHGKNTCAQLHTHAQPHAHTHTHTHTGSHAHNATKKHTHTGSHTLLRRTWSVLVIFVNGSIKVLHFYPM